MSGRITYTYDYRPAALIRRVQVTIDTVGEEVAERRSEPRLRKAEPAPEFRQLREWRQSALARRAG